MGEATVCGLPCQFASCLEAKGMNTWTLCTTGENGNPHAVDTGGSWPTYGYFHVPFVILELVYMIRGRDLMCSLEYVTGKSLVGGISDLDGS